MDWTARTRTGDARRDDHHHASGGLSIAVPLLVVEALKIVGGIGLLQRRSWARILVRTIGFLSLFLFPIGTAYGMYAIGVLMKDDTVRLLATADDAR